MYARSIIVYVLMWLIVTVSVYITCLDDVPCTSLNKISICLSVCLSVCMSVNMLHYVYTFICQYRLLYKLSCLFTFVLIYYILFGSVTCIVYFNIWSFLMNYYTLIYLAVQTNVCLCCFHSFLEIKGFKFII